MRTPTVLAGTRTHLRGQMGKLTFKKLAETQRDNLSFRTRLRAGATILTRALVAAAKLLPSYFDTGSVSHEWPEADRKVA